MGARTRGRLGLALALLGCGGTGQPAPAPEDPGTAPPGGAADPGTSKASSTESEDPK